MHIHSYAIAHRYSVEQKLFIGFNYFEAYPQRYSPNSSTDRLFQSLKEIRFHSKNKRKPNASDATKAA